MEEVKQEEVEEEKEESVEAKKERFLKKYQQVIDSDLEVIESSESVQRPLSRAYLSLCPMNKG